MFLFAGAPARADDSLAQTVADVNKKMVKLFGSGGFKGLASYGTGPLVATSLIRSTGLATAPAFVMVACGLLTLAASAGLRRGDSYVLLTGSAP